MRQYLLDFFKYNDWANRNLLETVKQLPDQKEAVKLFSHSFSAQGKWYNRISREKDDDLFPWFGPELPLYLLEYRWSESVNRWICLLEAKNEIDLEADIVFQRKTEGKRISVKVRDVMLQLNYHSIHPRAQINRIIRDQGLPPLPTDYILTVMKEA